MSHTTKNNHQTNLAIHKVIYNNVEHINYVRRKVPIFKDWAPYFSCTII